MLLSLFYKFSTSLIVFFLEELKRTSNVVLKKSFLGKAGAYTSEYS